MKKNFKNVFFVSLFAVVCFNMYSNAENINKNSNTINIGIVALNSIEKTSQDIKPLVDTLSKELGKEVKPFIANNYIELTNGLKEKKIDIAFLTPNAYVLANNEANIKVALKSERNGKSVFYSTIVTRKDSGINTIEDLKNKTFSFGNTLSPFQFVLAQKIFLDKKIEPKLYLKNISYSSTNDITLLKVLNKQVDAGAVYCNDNQGKDCSWIEFLKTEKSEQLKAIAFSEATPTDNICIRKEIYNEIENKVKKVFIDFNKNIEGKKLLIKLYHIDGFAIATDKDYEVLRDGFNSSGIDIKSELLKQNKYY